MLEHSHDHAQRHGLDLLLAPLETLSRDDQWRLRENARLMALHGGPKSRAGEHIVDRLMGDVVDPAQSGSYGPQAREKARRAIGAIVADLLLSAADEGAACNRSLDDHSFQNQPVARRAFARVRPAIEAAGLIDYLPGFHAKAGGANDYMRDWKAVTCFRPTPRLVELAAMHGVTLDEARLHFRRGAEASKGADKRAPVVLRGRKVPVAIKQGWKREKAPADEYPVPLGDPVAAAIVERMERLNAHLCSGRIDGFVFHGLRRIFSDVDQPGFAYQRGGRLYSMPGAEFYETWKGGATTRAKRIRIDDEQVAEVDISASHLTILHGLLGEPFDPAKDPYELPGHDRNRVKDWAKMALGQSKLAAGGPAFAAIREAMTARHPVLSRLGLSAVGTLDLQFHEAEIILRALESLRDQHGLVALPVHDALVVPESRRILAKQVLCESFAGYLQGYTDIGCDVLPRII